MRMIKRFLAPAAQTLAASSSASNSSRDPQPENAPQIPFQDRPDGSSDGFSVLGSDSGDL